LPRDQGAADYGRKTAPNWRTIERAMNRKQRRMAAKRATRTPMPAPAGTAVGASAWMAELMATHVLEHFRRRFPGDKAMRDLDHWHTFEAENALVFAGMYQFWIQKR
jgi:hypothetical protein